MSETPEKVASTWQKVPCNNPLVGDIEIESYDSGEGYDLISHTSLKDVPNQVSHLNLVLTYDLVLHQVVFGANKEYIGPHIVVKCTLTDLHGRHIEEYGEVMPETLTSSIASSYPMITAQNRAMDRALITYLRPKNISPSKRFYSDSEMPDAGEKTVFPVQDMTNIPPEPTSETKSEAAKKSPAKVTVTQAPVKAEAATDAVPPEPSAEPKAKKETTDATKEQKTEEVIPQAPAEEPVTKKSEATRKSEARNPGKLVIPFGAMQGKTVEEVWQMAEGGDKLAADNIRFYLSAGSTGTGDLLKVYKAVSAYNCYRQKVRTHKIAT